MMTKYKFEDIAFNSKIKKKPVEEDKYTYIGLEHLDGGSLQVTRYGSEVAPIGEKLIMEKGDVLFGKRRAYQKKVAIAPFDGIFSAHGMVLRPKENVINKEFFPFFISSDYFLDAAIKISVGSLSPTINWGDLKALEFNLPAVEEQERLAKILWAAEFLKQRLLQALDNAKTLKKSFIDNLIDNISKYNGKMVPLISACSKRPQYGSTASKISYNGKIRYIRITDINNEGELIDSEIASPSKFDEKYLLKQGDMLFARSGTVGLTYLHSEMPNCIYAGYLIRFFVDKKIILPEFLFEVTKSNYYLSWIDNIKRTGTISNINAQEFSDLLIPLVKRDVQLEIINKCKISNHAITKLSNEIERITNLQMSILKGGK